MPNYVNNHSFKNYKSLSLILAMDNNNNLSNGELLLHLVNIKMPFGKYKDVILCNLPVSYLEWFSRKGFPKGKLGALLATIYEIKINGLEYLLEPLKKYKIKIVCSDKY